MVPLGEVAPIVRRPVEAAVGSDYPIIAARSFGRGTFHQPTLEGDGLTWQRLFQVRAGDLLVSNIKAWEGAVAVVSDPDDGMYCSHRYLTCVADRRRVLPAWLGAVFRTPAAVAQLAAASPGSADRNRTLSMDGLRGVLVPLPPLDVQRRIVERLDAVEARIAKRRSEAEAVDEELAALLAAAFRRIAENAPRARMADVAPIVRRPVVIDTDATYREIGARAFGRGLFEKPPLRGDGLTWQKLFLIEEGDLVVSNIKAWEGAFAVADAAHHGAVGSHRYLTSVVDRRRATPGFIWFFLQSPPGIAQVQAASPGSADRNRTLSQDRFAAIEVPVPSLDAQHWFDALQQKARAAREAQASAAAELEHLVPALLDDAFGSG
jgi:type I restriction enzyme S subunit